MRGLSVACHLPYRRPLARRPSVARTPGGGVPRPREPRHRTRIRAMSISAHPKARRGASSSVTYGAGLTFETLLEHDADDAPFRLHEHEDRLLRVIAGIVRLSVD